MFQKQEMEKSFTVDGNRYRIRKLLASDGMPLVPVLLGIVAKSLKGLDGFTSIKDEAAMMSIFSNAVLALDPATFTLLVGEMRKNCDVQVNNDWPSLADGATFDLHFAGRYAAMVMWLYQCLLFNFGTFLGGSSLEKMVESFRATPSPSLSPTV